MCGSRRPGWHTYNIIRSVSVCARVYVSKSQTILISCKDLTARVVVMTSTVAVAALQTALKA